MTFCFSSPLFARRHGWLIETAPTGRRDKERAHMSFVPTATAVLNYWVRILGALEKKINRQSYETWLKPTRFSHISGKTLFVRIPSSDFQHIGDRYADLI